MRVRPIFWRKPVRVTDDEQRLRDTIRHASKASPVSIRRIRDEVLAIYQRKWTLIAMRYSRGNVLLSRGQILSAQDVDDVYGTAPWRS
ncbi:MAG: hypothetical protein EON60_00620 [Alphaproteobacteria bacterium]|nr:MAG: hypothetical protein EON60_00620 [Alphaproteobacteria bacterium]